MGRPLHNNSNLYAPKHAVTIDKSGCLDKQEYGSIQIDFCDMVLRIHNDCRPGGVALVPMIANCPDENGNPPVIPRLTVPAPVTVPAGEAVRVNHESGYRPIVQVMDEAGELVTVNVQHEDDNNFVVTNSTDGPVTVIYR